MKFVKETNRIYANNENGKLVAEITFPENVEGTCTIDHTFVDDSLRGQGVAGQLMEMAVIAIKEQKKEIDATCSYAVGWFEKHPEI